MSGQKPHPKSAKKNIVIERVQSGVRLEKKMLKVLKALAEYHDFSLAELLESIVLHAFEGKPPFNEQGLKRIADLKNIYGMTLDASASHRLIDPNEPEG